MRNKIKVYDYMDDVPCCEVSGKYCQSWHPHHIKPVGAGGEDHSDNLIRLTLTLHKECEQIGNKEFAIKYKVEKIRKNLINRYLWEENDEKRYKNEKK